jgi:hypothetical protein
MRRVYKEPEGDTDMDHINTTALIALEDDQLDCVAGGTGMPAPGAWKGIQMGDVNINIDIDVNTQVNIINFIGNMIKANGDVLFQFGQQA